MESGWLYCLYNPAFEAYGETVYKIGRTNNLQRRLRDYTTGFIHPSHYTCISTREFKDSRKAEAVVHYLLRRFRVTKDREFFKLDSERIRSIIHLISDLNDKEVTEIFFKTCEKICPKIILDNVLTEKDFEIFFESTDLQTPWEEFFEKFRFKPANPERYYQYGYRDPEKEDLIKLKRKPVLDNYFENDEEDTVLENNLNNLNIDESTKSQAESKPQKVKKVKIARSKEEKEIRDRLSKLSVDEKN